MSSFFLIFKSKSRTNRYPFRRCTFSLRQTNRCWIRSRNEILQIYIQSTYLFKATNFLAYWSESFSKQKPLNLCMLVMRYSILPSLPNKNLWKLLVSSIVSRCEEIEKWVSHIFIFRTPISVMRWALSTFIRVLTMGICPNGVPLPFGISIPVCLTGLVVAPRSTTTLRFRGPSTIGFWSRRGTAITENKIVQE